MILQKFTGPLPETGVGGYENTVLDLIFNLGGAAVAVIVHSFISKSKTQ